jgi:hypothetical protein
MTQNDGSIIILAVLIWSFVLIVANFFCILFIWIAE